MLFSLWLCHRTLQKPVLLLAEGFWASKLSLPAGVFIVTDVVVVVAAVGHQRCRDQLVVVLCFVVLLVG